MATLLLVALLAVVQSVFGVGVLFFGTPLMLLMGSSFVETLCTLLPASIAISALQLLTAGEPRARQNWRDFALWALPALVAGLAWRMSMTAAPRIELLLAALLLASAAVRHVDRASRAMQRVLAAHQRASLSMICLVHGFTNMGGAVLSSYAGMRYRDKAQVTHCIALIYLPLVAAQLLLLMLLRAPGDPLPSALTPLVAAAAYVLAGRRIGRLVGQRPYHVALSSFMALCAGVLILRQFA